MKTVGEVRDMILANRSNGSERLKRHADSLLGPRTHGSTTLKSIYDVPRETPLMEVFGNSVLKKGCRLFTFRADMGGIIGALPLYEVLKAYSGHIKVVTGLHEELELQIDSTDASLAGDDAWYERCDNIYVITGDHEGEEAVFTWHPGEPLGQLRDGLTEMTAVKIKR